MAHAPVFWAQRKDKLFVKIDLPEVKNEKVSLTEERLTFTGVSNGKDYTVDIEFYAPVSTEDAKWAFHGKSAQFVIQKKESAPYWPRLTKVNQKFAWLKADWDKWVDEDEVASDDEFAGTEGMQGFPGMMGGMPGMGGMGGFPPGMMGGMGGMPDFSQLGNMADMGDDEDDDDDSDLPPLESNQ